MPSTWTTCHMHDGDHAEVSIVTGCVNLKPKDREYPSVSLFLGSLTRAKLTAAAINGELDRAIESAFHDGFAAGMDADDRPCAEQASEAWADETPEPCTEEAFARGCFCYVPAPGPTDIDPPEPKRHPGCPLHGWRDPDAELERKRDDEMMERLGAGGSD